MNSDALYTKDGRRYRKVGYHYRSDCLPEGIHLVYVKHSDGCRTIITYLDIDLEEARRKAVIAASTRELTDIVMEACELYPAQKLNEEELAQWEEFKKTKAGKKLVKGMYRKSAADIARDILEKVVK